MSTGFIAPRALAAGFCLAMFSLAAGHGGGARRPSLPVGGDLAGRQECGVRRRRCVAFRRRACHPRAGDPDGRRQAHRHRRACPAAPCANAGRHRRSGARTERRWPSRCASPARMRVRSIRSRPTAAIRRTFSISTAPSAICKYAPNGKLAMLAVEGATKEVGATQPGAPITGDLSRRRCPSSASAFSTAANSSGSRRRTCSSMNMTGCRTARASSARRRLATATTIGGSRSSIASMRTTARRK